jgi:hypothetical protein
VKVCPDLLFVKIAGRTCVDRFFVVLMIWILRMILCKISYPQKKTQRLIFCVFFSILDDAYPTLGEKNATSQINGSEYRFL